MQTASWDVVSTTFSHNGKYRATIINQDGRPVVSVVEAASGSSVTLPPIPNASVTSVRFSRSESKLSLSVGGDRSPNNLYVSTSGGSGRG